MSRVPSTTPNIPLGQRKRLFNELPRKQFTQNFWGYISSSLTLRPWSPAGTRVGPTDCLGRDLFKRREKGGHRLSGSALSLRQLLPDPSSPSRCCVCPRAHPVRTPPSPLRAQSSPTALGAPLRSSNPFMSRDALFRASNRPHYLCKHHKFPFCQPEAPSSSGI